MRQYPEIERIVNGAILNTACDRERRRVIWENEWGRDLRS